MTDYKDDILTSPPHDFDDSGQPFIDLPPRRWTPSKNRQPQEDRHYNEQEDDGQDVLDDLENFRHEQGKRSPVPSAKWASNDEVSPCYAHLTKLQNAPVLTEKLFDLTPASLDLLIAVNHFRPFGPDNLIVFALRGARLVGTDMVEGAKHIQVEDVRPDHKTFRCIIGYYDREKQRLSAYTASTVPHENYMDNYYRKKNGLSYSKNINCNILPTGCYVYRVGAHNKGRISPALRLTNPDRLHHDGRATILRTWKDLTYSLEDLWDPTRNQPPYDNIHCAYSNSSFSSAGCLTIKGKNKRGVWGQFQKVLARFKSGTRIDVVLLTGTEAAFAESLLISQATDAPHLTRILGRLRHGSEGSEVTRLQKRLGFKGTGYFGPETKMRLVETQDRNNIPTDGIYSPKTDQFLAWDILSGSVAGTPSGHVTSVTGQGLDPTTVTLSLLSSGSILGENGKVLTVPGQGVWRVNISTGAITFSPETNFIGSPTPITYHVADSDGAKAAGTVSVEVIAQNQKPVSLADNISTLEDVPVTIPVLENDTDLDGSLIPSSLIFINPPIGATLTADGQQLDVPEQGNWTVDAHKGTVLFVPDKNWHGKATPITYQVSDDKGSKSSAKVMVTVISVNDPPIIMDDAATTSQNTPVTIDVLKNDKDIDSAAIKPLQQSSQQVDTAQQLDAPSSDGSASFNLAQLHKLTPQGKDYILNSILDETDLLKQAGILDSPLRWSHFVAQIGHETDYFKTLVEYGDKNYFQRYDGRTDLGNIRPGDGYRYRGRGHIQLTGRYNYRSRGGELNLDFEGNPDQVATPQISMKAAISYWSSRKINALADDNNLRAVTKAVNGGRNGLKQRQALFNKAIKMWQPIKRGDHISRYFSHIEEDLVSEIKHKAKVIMVMALGLILFSFLAVFFNIYAPTNQVSQWLIPAVTLLVSVISGYYGKMIFDDCEVLDDLIGTPSPKDKTNENDPLSLDNNQ